MDHNCGVIESICAELMGTFIICSILLTGTTLDSYETYEYYNETGSWKVHDFLRVADQFTNLSKDHAKATENLLAYGLILASAMTYTIHISGGHLNPAVTLGAFICGYIRIIPALCYIVAQIVGALLGEVTAKWIVEKRKPIDVAAYSQFAIGVLASFLLVSVYLSVTDPRKFGKDVGSAPLAIGLTALALALSEYKIFMNPAICLATSVHYEYFAHDWVYWIAPIFGGVAAGIVYRALARYNDSPTIRVDYSESKVTIKV